MKKTINAIIAVLPLLNIKPGHIKGTVKDTVEQLGTKNISLDLTDVDTCTHEEEVITLNPEALQEMGICDPKPIANRQ